MKYIFEYTSFKLNDKIHLQGQKFVSLIFTGNYTTGCGYATGIIVYDIDTFMFVGVSAITTLNGRLIKPQIKLEEGCLN